jgi:hypothetical protein
MGETLRPIWVLAAVDDLHDKGYRAELWVQPYTGFRLAVTRTVKTQLHARRDGVAAFGATHEDPHNGDPG